MKKTGLSILLLSSLTILSSCNTTSEKPTSSDEQTSNSTSMSEVKAIENVIATIGRNFTVEARNKTEKFEIIYNENYYYDTSAKGGLILTQDSYLYTYTLINDNILLPNLPLIGNKSTYFESVKDFELDMEQFTNNDGVFTSTNKTVCETISRLAKYSAAPKVKLSLSGENLTFQLIDNDNQSYVSGLIKDINNSTFKLAEDYIKQNIIPEGVRSDNVPLQALMSSMYDNFSYNGADSKGAYNFMLTKDYYYVFSNTSNPLSAGNGYIVLNDDVTRSFTVSANNLSVDYEFQGERPDFDKSMNLGKVDYSKFVLINEETNEYISKDYYNCYNLVFALGIDVTSEKSTVPNAVTISLTRDETATIKFEYNNRVLAVGVISKINATKIELLDNYLSEGTMPSLPKANHPEFVNSIKMLTDNFTVYSRYDADDSHKEDVPTVNEIPSIYSSTDGRYEVINSSLDGEENYIKYGDKAYQYTEFYEYFVKDQVIVKPHELRGTFVNADASISINKFESTYTFNSIPWDSFIKSGDVYFLDSYTVSQLVAKTIGNPLAKESLGKTTVKLLTNNNFLITTSGSTYSFETFVTNVGTTAISKYQEYKKEHVVSPVKIENDNVDLSNIFNTLKKDGNYTIDFYSNYGGKILYTPETILFEDGEYGFTTGEYSKQVFEFDKANKTIAEKPNKKFRGTIQEFMNETSFDLIISNVKSFFKNDKVPNSYISFDPNVLKGFESLCMFGDFTNRGVAIKFLDDQHSSFNVSFIGNDSEITDQCNIIDINNTVIDPNSIMYVR